MVAHGYGELVWNYLILNRKPHTNWDAVPNLSTVAAAE
jgi:hypothetical protein